ncbi:hypothetical protein QWZ14_29345 [Paeniroseomonas aquatica]|uniref:Uncharacterized protein n=1 Tax=Paeniroseomonas aquatica TaxID=373043 RepID=A0ABT8AFA7_9PROT|nr:hypothetical protein [Paeniroseomonas aquatica]MDN3568502.1 hypothetical protein [Paeniroseomonas aquatica]
MHPTDRLTTSAAADPTLPDGRPLEPPVAPPGTPPAPPPPALPGMPAQAAA